jgi:hypothetical protein
MLASMPVHGALQLLDLTPKLSSSSSSSLPLPLPLPMGTLAWLRHRRDYWFCAKYSLSFFIAAQYSVNNTNNSELCYFIQHFSLQYPFNNYAI